MLATSTTSTDQVFAEIKESLAQGCDLAWTCVDAADLRAGIDHIAQLRNQLDALAGEIALATETMGAHRIAKPDSDSPTRYRTVANFAGDRPGGSAAVVRGDVNIARWLLDYPVFAQAAAQGRVSRQRLTALRRVDRPQTHRAMIDDQHDLVSFAETLNEADFAAALQYWVNAVDPDGTIPDEQQANAHLRLKRHGDGSVTIEGELDPLNGTKVHTAVLAEIERLRARDAGGEGAPRSERELMIDALVALIERGSARADGGSMPLLNLVLSERVAEQLLAKLLDPHGDIAVDIAYDDVDGRCEFIDGTPLHPKLAMQVMLTAEFRRIILTPDSRPDVSFDSRAFPQWIKDTGLVLTRGRCGEWGCDAPHHWIQADHYQPYSKGGASSLDNEVPLCRPSNHAKSAQWPPPDWAPRPPATRKAQPRDPDDPDEPAA